MLTRMKKLDHCFEWYSFPNILNLSLTNENVPTLRASREVRTPLEGEYIEGEAAPPSKRKTLGLETLENSPKTCLLTLLCCCSQQERLARVADWSQLALWGRDGRWRWSCCRDASGGNPSKTVKF